MPITHFCCGLCHANSPCNCEREASERRDPWVKVGTTTIDGDVCGLWESDDLDEMRGRVRFIGGHHLRLEWWETNRGVDIAFCDIVRRQSEIDAEKVSRDCAIFDGLMRVHMANHPCPECGPHGNAGRVLLLESWVDCGTCKPDASAVVFDDEVEVQRARDQGAAAGRAAIGLRGAREVAALRGSLTEAAVDNLRRYEAITADFKVAITFDPVIYRPGEFSFAASDLCMPTHSRAPSAVTADVGQAESTLEAIRYPTRDEYANYLSAHLAANLGAVDYDDASISRAARMIDDLSGGQWLLVASQALVP